MAISVWECRSSRAIDRPLEASLRPAILSGLHHRSRVGEPETIEAERLAAKVVRQAYRAGACPLRSPPEGQFESVGINVAHDIVEAD